MPMTGSLLGFKKHLLSKDKKKKSKQFEEMLQL